MFAKSAANPNAIDGLQASLLGFAMLTTNGLIFAGESLL
jgi:hypothetical protein